MIGYIAVGVVSIMLFTTLAVLRCAKTAEKHEEKRRSRIIEEIRRQQHKARSINGHKIASQEFLKTRKRFEIPQPSRN